MGLFSELLPPLIMIMSVVLVYLAGKYLKLQIDKETIKPIISSIINLILKAEKNYDTGVVRKEIVINELDGNLNGRQKKLLSSFFGSLSNAVEFVFQTIVQPNLLRRLSNIYRKK